MEPPQSECLVMVVAMAIFAVRRFASLLEPPRFGGVRAAAPGHGVGVRRGEVWRWIMGSRSRTDTELANNQMHQTGTLAFAPRSIV